MRTYEQVRQLFPHGELTEADAEAIERVLDAAEMEAMLVLPVHGIGAVIVPDRRAEAELHH